MRHLPLLSLLLAACTSKDPDSGDTDTDTDTDSDTDTDTDSDADTDTDADPVDALTYDGSADEDGFQGARFGWIDSDLRLRTALMVRNDAEDPWGTHGGYLRTFTYVLESGATRTCTGSNYTHPGFGETVNHWSDTATVSHMAGTWDVPFVGRHHAQVAYRWDLPISGETVQATVVWTFATGLDHPIYAVTFDSSDAEDGAVVADSRTPYGDIDWDGGLGSDVDGVGWGDHYRFTSTDSPVDLSSGWDYTVPNEVPYVREWAVAADAEMGTVQTQTMDQHDAGGYWFYDRWGTADADGPMPDDWNWTYQLNQYEMPFTLESKRVAWGTNYGAVGSSEYDAYGYLATLSGWPYQSYAVYVVLDEYSDDPVLTRVEQMERVQGVTLAASTGEVLGEVPGGVDRSDTVPSDPGGWDPSAGAFHLAADGGAVAFSVAFPDGAVENPMFLVDGWTGGDPVVTLDGATATADADYYASVDADRDQLWLTLAGNVSSTVEVTVE